MGGVIINDLKSVEMKAELQKVDGHSINDDDMNWTVECPECLTEIEYEGYFEASDLNKCKCGCCFLTRRIYFDDGSYLE